MRVLVADAGNSSTTYGVFDGDRLTASFSIQRQEDGAAAQLSLVQEQLARYGVSGTEWHGAVVGSVASATDVTAEVVARATGLPPLIATPTTPGIGVPIAYADPAALGIDRLANALAAHEWLADAAIVVDFGTATQFDCVSADGRFLGGAICAGPQLSLDALSTRSKRLPPLRLQRPVSVLATETSAALQSGAFFGQAALADGMVRRLFVELEQQCPVIATGGYCSDIGPECNSVTHIRPDLTLQGLRLIWQRCR